MSFVSPSRVRFVLERVPELQVVTRSVGGFETRWEVDVASNEPGDAICGVNVLRRDANTRGKILE